VLLNRFVFAKHREKKCAQSTVFPIAVTALRPGSGGVGGAAALAAALAAVAVECGVAKCWKTMVKKTMMDGVDDVQVRFLQSRERGDSATQASRMRSSAASAHGRSSRREDRAFRSDLRVMPTADERRCLRLAS
jgi:hypothetical protein